MTVVGTITALAAAGIAAVLRSRRARVPEPAAAAAPVVIPVSRPASEDGSDDEPVQEVLRSA